MRRNARHRLTRRREKRRQLPVNARPDRACGVLFALDQLRRHHDVGVDGPAGHAELLRKVFPPLVGLAKGVFVADDHHGVQLVRHRREAMMWIGAQKQSDAAPAQTRREIFEAFDEKTVMPEVRPPDKRSNAQENDDGLLQQVAELDRDVERRVVGGALRALHPVDDCRAVQIGWARTPHHDTWIVANLFECHGSGRAREATLQW